MPVISYGGTVIHWITSYHKNRMTTRVITVLRERVTSPTMCFLILNAIKLHFKGSCDKQNLAFVVISYEIVII